MKVKLGDTIEHRVYGLGIIEFISPNKYAVSPVKAYFKDRRTYGWFTKEGKDYKGAPFSNMRHWGI